MKTSTSHLGNLAIPLPLYYWPRPWAKAHIYQDCPVSARDWAGQDFKQMRTIHRVRGAMRHTQGLCVLCWLAYNRQVRDGR